MKIKINWHFRIVLLKEITVTLLCHVMLLGLRSEADIQKELLVIMFTSAKKSFLMLLVLLNHIQQGELRGVSLRNNNIKRNIMIFFKKLQAPKS